MKVWINDSFTGFYPVGVAAVIVAVDAKTAEVILNGKLKKEGLRGDAEAADMREIDLTEGNCVVICNGDY